MVPSPCSPSPPRLAEEKATTSTLLRLQNRLLKLHGRVEIQPCPENSPSHDPQISEETTWLRENNATAYVIDNIYFITKIAATI
jgi:hypothetical protein